MVRTDPNRLTGILYFYIHFVTEAVCFYTLTSYIGSRPEIWVIYLAYDFLAFMPQSLIGSFSDRHPKVPLGAAGLVMLAAALVISGISEIPFLSLFILCIGNCFVHVNGAEATLRTAEGKLSGSAIFVSGGSFGVVTGRLMPVSRISMIILLLLILTAFPAVLKAQRYINDDNVPYRSQCRDFRYAKKSIPVGIVVAMAVTVVAVRGFMGYGIPTAWNKTVVQTILLFACMGTGKALGGIAADRFGFRRTALISTVAAVPFLMGGNDHMLISLVGVMLFSMTMAITLGILVSVMPEAPGLAFGWTTIGLFMGSAPVFFFKLLTTKAECVMILMLSLICLALMVIMIRKD